MTTEEILALLQAQAAKTQPIQNANNQPMLDMINANKAELQPIVDQITASKQNMANTEANYLDYGNPTSAGDGMTMGERLIARESATMPDRLSSIQNGLNVAERTITPNAALGFYNSDLAGQLEGAKAGISGTIGLGDMQESKNDLEAKMANAAADRAASATAASIKAKAAADAERSKSAEAMTKYVLDEMAKGTMTADQGQSIIKTYIPEASDDKISMLLGRPANFEGSAQNWYDFTPMSEEEKNKKKATGAINGLITGNMWGN